MGIYEQPLTVLPVTKSERAQGFTATGVIQYDRKICIWYWGTRAGAYDRNLKPVTLPSWMWSIIRDSVEHAESRD